MLAASLLALFGVTMFFFRMPFNIFHTGVVVLSPDLAPLVTAGWVVLRIIGAVVVVNSAGNIADPSTGLPWMADQILEFGLVPPPADQIAAFAQRDAELSPLNTTIAVVATDATLSPAGCRRLAIAAQDALARTIRPSHTPLDGDTVFALATGAVDVPPRADTPAGLSPETALITAVGAAAADCLARAAMVGVLAADSIAGIPTYRDMLPGAFG